MKLSPVCINNNRENPISPGSVFFRLFSATYNTKAVPIAVQKYKVKSTTTERKVFVLENPSDPFALLYINFQKFYMYLSPYQYALITINPLNVEETSVFNGPLVTASAINILFYNFLQFLE